MNDFKVYVPVIASFDLDGRILPREIVWEDGPHYHIDRVVDIRQATAGKVGSGGDRYTVFVVFKGNTAHSRNKYTYPITRCYPRFFQQKVIY